MCELHAAGADREQAGIREQVDHGGDVATPVLDLLSRKPKALDPALDLHLGQPQEHRPGDGLLSLVEPAEAVLGKARDRAAHPAGVLVGREAQMPPVASLPELEQRRGQQWQLAGLVLDVVHERLDELGLHDEADALRRAHDRAPELDVLHGSDQHVILGEQARQLGIRGAAPVEVGAERHHDDGARVPLR